MTKHSRPYLAIRQSRKGGRSRTGRKLPDHLGRQAGVPMAASGRSPLVVEAECVPAAVFDKDTSARRGLTCRYNPEVWNQRFLSAGTLPERKAPIDRFLVANDAMGYEATLESASVPCFVTSVPPGE